MDKTPTQAKILETPPSTIERLSWAEFIEHRFIWNQGQHITVIAPTGQGKTSLCLYLLRQRWYVVVVAVKKKDPVVEMLLDDGWVLTRDWPPPKDAGARVILWPRIEELRNVSHQRAVIHKALDDIYSDGGWCVYFDELGYVGDPRFLGLGPEAALLLFQGRSIGVTVVSSITRPRGVPLEAYEMPSWLFIGRNNDKANQERLGEIQNVDRREVMAAIGNLKLHEFLIIETRTGCLTISKPVLF